MTAGGHWELAGCDFTDPDELLLFLVDDDGNYSGIYDMWIDGHTAEEIMIKIWEATVTGKSAADIIDRINGEFCTMMRKAGDYPEPGRDFAGAQWVFDH